MRSAGTALLAVAALGLGGTAGYLLSSSLREPVLQAARDRERKLEEEIASLRKEIKRLSSEREGREGLIATLEAEIEKRREKDATALEASTGSKQGETSTGSPGAALPLGALEEADAIFAEAVSRSDALALMDLAAALLSMGEPGFEKLIALFEELHQLIDKDEAKDFVHWSDPLYQGPLARILAHNNENVLRFGLYLDQKDADSLSREGRKLREVLTTDDFSNLLLGFYEGDDPDINRGFLEIFKQQLAAKPSSEAIKGLAHLPGDEATDILLDVATQGPSPVLLDAVLALAYRGDKRALPALEALRDRVGSQGEADEDRALAQAIHVAIRALK